MRTTASRTGRRARLCHGLGAGTAVLLVGLGVSACGEYVEGTPYATGSYAAADQAVTTDASNTVYSDDYGYDSAPYSAGAVVGYPGITGGIVVGPGFYGYGYPYYGYGYP